MPNPAIFEQQMEDVRAEMREMRGVMGQMANALTKLSVLEERNLVASEAIKQLGVRQDRTENEVSDLKMEQVKFQGTVSGISSTMKLLWAVFGTGMIYLGAQAFSMVAK